MERKTEYVARQMAHEAEETYYLTSRDHLNYNKWLCGRERLKEYLLTDRTDILFSEKQRLTCTGPL